MEESAAPVVGPLVLNHHGEPVAVRPLIVKIQGLHARAEECIPGRSPARALALIAEAYLYITSMAELSGIRNLCGDELLSLRAERERLYRALADRIPDLFGFAKLFTQQGRCEDARCNLNMVRDILKALENSGSANLRKDIKLGPLWGRINNLRRSIEEAEGPRVQDQQRKERKRKEMLQKQKRHERAERDRGTAHIPTSPGKR